MSRQGMPSILHDMLSPAPCGKGSQLMQGMVARCPVCRTMTERVETEFGVRTGIVIWFAWRCEQQDYQMV